MKATSPTSISTRDRTSTLVILLASLLAAGIIGSVIAGNNMPIERKIELRSDSNTLRELVSDGHVLKYYSDGPRFAGFEWTHADYTIVSDHDAIVLATNGVGGAVELLIPAQLMKEYDSIIGKAVVADVKTTGGRPLEFQRISADDSYTRVRVNLPSGDTTDDGIRVFITSLDIPLPLNFVLQALAYCGMTWVPLLLSGILTFVAIERLTKKLSSGG